MQLSETIVEVIQGPDGMLVLVGRHTATVVNVSDDLLIAVHSQIIAPPRNEVVVGCRDPSGQMLMTVTMFDRPGVIRVWKLPDLVEKSSMALGNSPPTVMVPSAAGPCVIVGARDGTVWRVDTGGQFMASAEWRNNGRGSVSGLAVVDRRVVVSRYGRRRLVVLSPDFREEDALGLPMALDGAVLATIEGTRSVAALDYERLYIWDVDARRQRCGGPVSNPGCAFLAVLEEDAGARLVVRVTPEGRVDCWRERP